jgi:hypothetical protein
MAAVDGAWWDSSKRIPDWTLVKRRHSEIEGDLHAWRVSDASSAGAPAFTACADTGDPLVLRHPDGFEGRPFRDYLTLEYTPDAALLAQGFPLRGDGSRTVTQEDFPRIVAEIRRANAEAMGADANRP